jgi:hypothetical protein
MKIVETARQRVVRATMGAHAITITIVVEEGTLSDVSPQIADALKEKISDLVGRMRVGIRGDIHWYPEGRLDDDIQNTVRAILGIPR